MLRPLPNLATRQVPAGFDFGYMVAWGQAAIVDKFVPGLGGKTDPVGPSPVIMHVEQLKQAATLLASRPLLTLTLTLTQTLTLSLTLLLTLLLTLILTNFVTPTLTLE